MNQPGRTFTQGSGYRYGFNGKENDKEVSGDGNQYDYGFRIYNAMIGRFLSVDPITHKYPELTPYQFASNTPISAIDLDGKEAEIVIDKQAKEIHWNFKYTYTDANLKILEQQGVTLGNLKEQFNYYYVPDADGNTKAVKDALSTTGLSIEQLEEKLGGKIATGGEGYFNVNHPSEGVYKVFYSLQIDKNLKPGFLKGNFKLEFVENATSSFQDIEGIHLAVNSYATMFSLGNNFNHELGHQAGNPDYANHLSENPFKNRMANGPIKNPDGTNSNSTYGVGDIMDKQASGMSVVSLGSVERAVIPAISEALKVKENTVTLISGQNDNAEPNSTNKPPIITKKKGKI